MREGLASASFTERQPARRIGSTERRKTSLLKASACPDVQGIPESSTSVVGVPTPEALRGWLRSVRTK